MMAKSVTLYVFFIISNLFSLPYVGGERNGMSIKLIHYDSPESPFYLPNLTYIQKIERLVSQSKARLNYVSASNLKHLTDLRSKMHADSVYVFMAEIGVGSFLSTTEPYKSYYFDVDPGTDLTWLECKECKHHDNHCLRQNSEPFPDDISSSYEKLLINPRQGPRHPLCDPSKRIGQFCGYQVSYFDNSSSRGYLASETFTFDTVRGPRQKERVFDLVFGCGFDIRNMAYPNNNIAGILGLGRGPTSFVNQLGTKSNGKFSYCLQRSEQANVTTFLQFGDHIPTTHAIHRTRLVPYPAKAYHFVSLIGISVGGKPLKVREHDFARKSNDTGGCIIDSGSGITRLVPVAYVKLRKKLMKRFSHVPDLVRLRMGVKQLCYKRTGARQGFRNFPTITFHFHGANLQLGPENIFLLGELDGNETICMEIDPHDGENGMTIIGAYQQANHRFIYDIRNNWLSFGPENCGH